jgi:hypothetical protein
MTLFDLFQQALDEGGDAVSKALGHTEAQLVRDPDDTVARAMKGALLTLVTDDVLTEARRGEYRRTGTALMQEVLAQLPAFNAKGAATRFVVALGLVGLPVADGQRQAAEQLLRRLVHSPELRELQAWQQLRVQVMLAALAQLGDDDATARKAYAAAKAIDPVLAVQLFCAFIDRQGGGAK